MADSSAGSSTRWALVIDGHLQKPSGDEQDAITQFDTLRKQIGAAKGRSARDRCDQMVADIEELAKDPLANVDQLQRLRTALGPAAPA